MNLPQLDLPIDENWLRDLGFNWHQLERQPSKHWLLWIGGAFLKREMFTGPDDLGIEVAAGTDGSWFCWFRSDTAHRYHRFIHLRHIYYRQELVAIISALIGYDFDPANCFYGSLARPEHADYLRKENERLDLKWRHEASPHHKWSTIEKDDTRGQALPEHYEAHEKAKPSDPATL